MGGKAKVLRGVLREGVVGMGGVKDTGVRGPARPGPSAPLWLTRPLEQHPRRSWPSTVSRARLPQDPSLESPKGAYL